MDRRKIVRFALVCLMCLTLAVSVGAYTDYTANAQKTAEIILDNGQKDKARGDFYFIGGSIGGIEYYPSSNNLGYLGFDYSTEVRVKYLYRLDLPPTSEYAWNYATYRISISLSYNVSEAMADSQLYCRVEQRSSFDDTFHAIRGGSLPFDMKAYNMMPYKEYTISTRGEEETRPIEIVQSSLREYILDDFDDVTCMNQIIKDAFICWNECLLDYGMSLPDLGFEGLRQPLDAAYDLIHGSVTIYSYDGRTAHVFPKDVEKYLGTGWYDRPVTTMYAPDGRIILIYSEEIEAYKAVGWNTVPAITLYALNGSTINIWSSETAAYTAVGWYVGTTPITMYAPDGRTISVPIEQMTAYIGVGWSQYPIAA